MSDGVLCFSHEKHREGHTEKIEKTGSEWIFSAVREKVDSAPLFFTAWNISWVRHNFSEVA